MVSIKRITFSVEIFLRNPLLNDNARFRDAFAKNGFSLSYGTPEQPVMMRDRFTVRTARAPRVKDKALNLAAISIALDEVEKFVAHIISTKEIVKILQIDLDKELKSCSVLANAWVETANNPADTLNRLKDIKGIASLQGFTCHRTPFEKLEFVSVSLQGRLDYDEWQKVDVDYTESDEYLVSMHYHGNSLTNMIEYLKTYPDRVTSIINGIESKALE